MADVVFSHDVLLPLDQVSAFSSFGDGSGTGWLMTAQVTLLAPGQVVELTIPLDGGAALRGTARVVEIRPYRRLVLRHESPWSGETVVTFTPQGGGTRVRLTARLTPDALGELSQRMESTADDDALQVGLVMSLSGDASIFGRAIVNCAELAASEINADGGVLGRPVRIARADEATDGLLARARLYRLMKLPHLAAVVGSHTSSTLDALNPLIQQNGILYLFVPVNEGGPREGNLFRLGESALDQFSHSIPLLMERTGARSWYLLGHEYSWPRHVNRTARRVIAGLGGRIVRERYLDLETRDFQAAVEDVADSGADLLLSTLIGFGSVGFERVFVAAGLRSRITTLSGLLEDSTLDHLGPLADGIWSSLSYFGGEAADNGFRQRYRDAYGAVAPPPSTISASVYDGVHLWARAARTAGTTAPTTVADHLPGATFTGSRGRVQVTADGRLRPQMFLAQVVRGQFRVADSFREPPPG